MFNISGARTWLFLAIIALLIVFSGLPSNKSSASDLHKIILTTHNLPPYGSYQDDGSFRGVAVDVVECALHKIQQPFEILVVPWKRAQVMVQKHVAHGFFAGSQNKKRDSYAVMSAIIADQKWVWYLPKDSSLDPFSEDFRKNARVASFVGANMLKWLIDNKYNVAAKPSNSKALIEMLSRGRLDAVLINNYVGAEIINKLELHDQFRIVVNKNKPLGVYFDKDFIHKSPGFLDKFNEAVPACRQETGQQ